MTVLQQLFYYNLCSKLQVDRKWIISLSVKGSSCRVLLRLFIGWDFLGFFLCSCLSYWLRENRAFFFQDKLVSASDLSAPQNFWASPEHSITVPWRQSACGEGIAFLLVGRSRNIWAVPLQQPRAGHVDTLLIDRQWPVYFVTVNCMGYRQHCGDTAMERKVQLQSLGVLSSLRSRSWGPLWQSDFHCLEREHKDMSSDVGGCHHSYVSKSIRLVQVKRQCIFQLPKNDTYFGLIRLTM